MKKKICVIVHSRANYGSIKSVLKNIKKSKNLTLKLIVGGSALLDKFGSATNYIEKDGFKIDKKINFIIEGNSPEIMAKSTGLAIIETADTLGVLKPDYVLTVGDRYETIATAISAAYMNIPLIHTMGGEISGTIDESVRHAVTKFANIHFAATHLAKKNIIRMGEVKKNVFNVGCPRIDEVKIVLSQKISNGEINKILNSNGVGNEIDISRPFIIVMYHPVTSEYGNGEDQIINILKAIAQFNIQKIFFWPNADAGYEDIARGIRKWREKNLDTNTRYIKNLEQKYFYHLLDKSRCIIGNSSSGLREGCYIGVKNISIGSRQNGREIGNNTIMISNNYRKIYISLKKILKLNYRKKKDYRYGNGNAGKKIVKIIEKIKVSHQKKLDY